jgi:trehalose synthase
LLPSCSGDIAPRKYKPNEERPEEGELMPLPRADPGYLQYLERNSMLTKSSEMAKVVSGSELAWRPPAGQGTPDELLGFADIWLAVNPLTILTSSRSSTFAQLANPNLWPVLREASIRGLYVAPIQGSGALWAKTRSGVETGEDVVQYAFSQAAGKDNEYQRLMREVIDNHAVIGSDLIPAATGIGPDFFLAARNVREYPGVYCMVDIPQKLWPRLPAVASEWDTAALDSGQVSALNSEGLLPKAMRDASSALGKGGGWAVTGEVRGVDGNTRRWVYRYYGSPKYAVLNWEDPSKTANRILSGGAVQQVGLRGQALIGLRFEAFQGLEAAPESGRGNMFSVEPALTAAQSMSREIRRYGGWSWMRDDNLPLNSVADFLRSGTDFIYDSAFSPAAEHALLTGDTTLACFMADEILRLNIDASRLVHAMPSQDGINYSLPYLKYLQTTAVGDSARAFRDDILESRDAFLSYLSPAPVKDGYLYTTSAGLAAMALNLPRTDTSAFASEVAKGHSLLVFFKAMQPGILMLSGQDLAGVLPLHYSSMTGSAASFDVANASRGSYALTEASEGLAVNAHGMPKAPQIYPAPDQQVHQQGSFLRRIGSFLRVRNAIGLSKGKLTARPATQNYGVIALLSRMPDKKGYVLTVCNFSRDTVRENISLSGTPGIGAALGTSKVLSLGGGHSISGSTVNVELGPWEGRAILLGSAAQGVTSVQGEAVTAVKPIEPTPHEELLASPLPEPVATPAGGKVAIDSPRNRVTPASASIATPSNEPASRIVPLARMSEDTAGRAARTALRPGQPAELVTQVPPLDGRPQAQVPIGKSPGKSNLFQQAFSPATPDRAATASGVAPAPNGARQYYKPLPVSDDVPPPVPAEPLAE